MKTETFYKMKKGDALGFTPEAADRYGYTAKTFVRFSEIQERPGRKTPYILAVRPDGCGMGYYHPKDFGSWEASECLTLIALPGE